MMGHWHNGSLEQWIIGAMDHWYDRSLVQWIIVIDIITQWFDGSLLYSTGQPYIGISTLFIVDTNLPFKPPVYSNLLFPLVYIKKVSVLAAPQEYFKFGSLRSS